MTNSVLSKLQTAFPFLSWEAEVPLAPFTYMKIGGPAAVILRLQDSALWAPLVQFCHTQEIPLLVLGGASNVLVDDAGWPGLVIINQCRQQWLWPNWPAVTQAIPELNGWPVATHTSHQYLGVESGLPTALTVRAAVDAGLDGLTPFLGVPGTVGGAIYNNAHYTSELIGNFVQAIEVCAPTGQLQWLTKTEAAFAYDNSRFQHSQEIIVRIIFALLPGDKAAMTTAMQAASAQRAATQPLGTANSGCMFKNVSLSPEVAARWEGRTTLAAGWLIDQAGLKGYRVGGAVVSTKHANFIVNTGTATSADVRRLVEHIQHTVWDRWQIKLEPEVFFLSTGSKGK